MKGDMMPRPDSIETYMLLMPRRFDPEGAGDTRATGSLNLPAALTVHAGALQATVQRQI